ncbi:MAG: IPT/TIG domain-containing protein, partial [Acidimicrobiales bacterium]|nr:IPT/TIG domain-containing protein [Acidimicrobiales bacterium]
SQGGYTLTISGANFDSTSSVSIGGVTAPTVGTITPTSIQVTVPSGIGQQSVVVSGDNGSSGVNNLFTYYAGGSYTAITPTRIVDTRSGATDPATYAGKTLNSSNESLSFAVAGVGGVPSNAVGVALNVTAIAPDTSGYLSLYPSGTSPPATSSLNFAAGSYAVANMVFCQIGTNGSVTVANFKGSVDVAIDVEGYVVSGSGDSFDTVSPYRAIDTRSGANDPSTYANETFGAGQTRSFQITGSGSPIPTSGVSTLAITLTVVNTKANGFASVFATGTPSTSPPTFSDINFSQGQTVSNTVFVPISASGSISIYLNQSADVVVDVVGWFGSSGKDQVFLTSPVRVADSRSASGYQDAGQTLSGVVGAPDTVTFAPTLIPTGVDGVIGNLTVTNNSTAGYLTSWSSSITLPQVSNVNWSSPGTYANAAVIGTSSTNQSLITSNAKTDFVIDVSGFFAPTI